MYLCKHIKKKDKELKKKCSCPLLEVPCLNLLFKLDRKRGFKSENQRILSL